MKEKEFTITFLLDSRVFSKNGIIKCLYWYSKEFEISIDIKDKYYFDIKLIPNNKLSKLELNKLKLKLNQEFIDYNLRDIVRQETTTIRELIIAKAFSHGEFDEEPKGDLMDPLGIKFL